MGSKEGLSDGTFSWIIRCQSSLAQQRLTALLVGLWSIDAHGDGGRDEPPPFGRVTRIIRFLARSPSYSSSAGSSAGSCSTVAGGLIHALAVVAAISLAWHCVRGRAVA